MRNRLMVFCMLLFLGAPAMAQVNIGISFSLFPELVPIQGYPVYYAPGLDSNYFFYDGMYWIYQGDNWYASSWYNGPWMLVDPEAVPLFILRVPVRYYRHPPAYFRGWQSSAPPRWDEHWGGEWSQRRRGWDRWDHNSVPAPAPLPTYQRNYAGDRYPQAAQQQALQSRNYRYQPSDPEVRQRYQAPAVQSAPPPGRRESQVAPQRDREDVRRSAPAQAVPQQRSPVVQEQRQQPRQEAVQHQPQEPKPRSQEAAQGRQKPQDSERGQGGDHEEAGRGDQERQR